MILNLFDALIIIAFFIILISIGIIAARNAGKSAQNFFLAGRNMPWWLLGVSMVATTFSCDTPNLVTDIVRQAGVSGNWAWWAFLLTGMLTVFIYAKLWRRSKVLTDLEFYEIRYSGKMAAFLRGFRSLYLGIIFNVLVIAAVSLALIKIGAVMIGWPAAKTLIVAAVVLVIYSTLGGLKSILLTDFFQFAVAMTGAIGAAVILVKHPEVGGLQNLLAHAQVAQKTSLFPDFNNRELVIGILILPLAVQWWSVWYPGAEPGGGGYIAQRMLSAKTEKGAMNATLLFNFLHYAVRPWPWILVALASIIVFPDIRSLQLAFPDFDPHYIKDDFAYPAMLSFLPHGFLGLVVASLIAAYMSTTASQLNWGASYVANDFYKRFINKNAGEKQIVLVGRISTVLIMCLAIIFALLMSNALQAFYILLQIGAGTGLIYILRWFWWRINAYTEIAGMIISFLVAIYFEFIHPALGYGPPATSVKLLSGVGITTVGWLVVTFLTKPVKKETLVNFYELTRPGGPGWKKIKKEMPVPLADEDNWDVPAGILCMLIGSITIYAALFAVGGLLYGQYLKCIVLSGISAAGIYVLIRLWPKLRMK